VNFGLACRRTAQRASVRRMVVAGVLLAAVNTTWITK
jgi:hypothetical protein